MSKSVPSHRWQTVGVFLVAAVVGCDGGTTDPTIGPPVKLAFTVQPTDATAGGSIAPAAAVAIQDASGNVVPTGTNAVTIAIGTNPAGGTLSGTATVNAVSGVANFTDLTIELAVSGYTLIASATGLTSATSAEFSITPAAAAQLGFTVQPTATEGNQPIAPAIEVTIRDAFGNTVTTAMDAVTVAIGTNPGGGTLSGTATVSAVGGIATFSGLSIDLPGGGYTLQGTSGTLTGATSSAFDIVDAIKPVATPGGFVTYIVGNQVFRVEALDGATPINVSTALNALASGRDESPAVSRNGQFFTIDTERFDPQCDGFSCLAVVASDLSAGETVFIGGAPLRVKGRAAISNSGDLIVYPSDGGPHDLDLFASRKTGATWGAPLLLTADSPHEFNDLPVLSQDANTVLFDCGPVPFSQNGTGICEVGIDAGGFRRVVDPDANPFGESGDFLAHHADYMPDGGIVFEADWDGEQVWIIPSGALSPVRVIASQSNDNSPCSLPGGFIASLWLERPGGSSVHELKIMAPDGSEFAVITPDVDITDIGMSCHQ